jgi:outer membrane protein insertion porin family
MKLSVLALFWLSFNGLMAQTAISTDTAQLPLFPYEKPQEYTIGGVRVSGAQYTDAQALIAISGLRVGERVRIPGPVITHAVQSLWNLRLFTDVQIIQERQQGEEVFLEIVVKELPRYTRHSFSGVRKSKHEDLNNIINRFLQRGSILTDNARMSVVNGIKNYYADKGYLDADVTIKTTPDERSVNGVKMDVIIKPGKRIKIREIRFVGVQQVKVKALRRKMKNTAQKSRIFKKSKLVEKDYEEDKRAVEAYYRTLGFRDARIVRDSVWRNGKGELMLQLTVNEGRRYYFRDITWKGNTIYDTRVLQQVLGISKGDVYNEELLNNRLSFSQDGRDVSSLYLDNGYLFFRADPIEVAIENDSVDIEIRIFEGPQATIDRVVIKGNDRTHEHVIRRELFTRPGDKFSRSDIIRSQREIVNLGYFNPEALGINTPVNPDRGTVDIEYTVEEKPSDQLELSAGYQPRTNFGLGGVIGTLGVTFNNFSLRNIRNREAWNPLPQGDGQRLSLRGQTSGPNFQSYNFSFTEPWLGGRKPNSLTVAAVYNRFAQGFEGTANYRRLDLLRGAFNFGTRLKFPDDNFIFRAGVEIQTYGLNNWISFQDDKGRLVSNGKYNNFNLNLTLARNSINDPIFPRAGSLFSASVQATPPYSFFRDRSFYEQDDPQRIYQYVEYLRWRFDAEWYTTIVGKLVFRSQAKVGILGRWSKKTNLSPFERYDLGGDGLNNQNFGLAGRGIISMRGYGVEDIMQPFPGGAGVFSKFTLELRYPVSLNPQSTIFVTTFAQGGNAWAQARDFNPFDLRRSAGVGLRVFLPMFGTLGFDYGFGFDKPDLIARGAKWTEFARFNIVLGFEPD